MTLALVPGYGSGGAFQLNLPGHVRNLAGISYLGASAPVPPGAGALSVSVDVLDFGAWCAANPGVGSHIGFCIRDDKARAPFDQPSGVRAPWVRAGGATVTHQWGSISTGAGLALGRAAGSGITASIEKFQKRAGEPVLVGANVPISAASIRATTTVRVVSAGSAVVDMDVRNLSTGALLAAGSQAIGDWTEDFGLGVSLIVVVDAPVGAPPPTSPTFANVRYNWIP